MHTDKAKCSVIKSPENYYIIIIIKKNYKYTKKIVLIKSHYFFIIAEFSGTCGSAFIISTCKEIIKGLL